MHGQHEIKPYLMSSTVVELPIFLMDGFYMVFEKERASFDIEKFKLGTPGRKVFDFHPVHIFLNTDTLERYESSKKEYPNPKELVKYRNTKGRGVRTKFVELLETMKSRSLGPKILLELSNDFRGSLNDG